jgi:DNA repair exonuclease SbcCD nuclease subunit
VIRLLHLSDAHLGAAYSGFGPVAETRRKEVLEAFRGLPDAADEHGVHAVVVCGDLFDGPEPDERILAAVREVSRRLQEAGRPVFAVPGNHDSISLDPSLYANALPGAHLFTEPIFAEPAVADTQAGPLTVYGFAYDRARESDPLSSFRRADMPGVHVVLLHGAVPDAPHWGEPSSLSLPAEGLAGLDADYVALGDYHRFRSPDEFGAGMRACYAGSFAAVDIAEEGSRGYVVADVESGTPPRVRHVSSGVREVIRLGDVDVGACPDELAVAELLRERAPEASIPVARLVGEPAFPLDVEIVRVDLEERYGCVRVEDATRFYASTRLAEIAQEPTVAGHAARLGLSRVGEADDAEERIEAERALRIALRSLGVT